MENDKIGRNDPCYCGSGKKYKRCHMAEDKAKERGRVAEAMAVKFLRTDMLAYARDERFAEPFARSIALYWNDLYTMDNMEEMAENEALRFFDWFIYDYSEPDHDRLIEQYKSERFDDLSSHQQAILDDWLTADAATGYELLSYEGTTLQLRDYFTDEEFEVYASGGRGSVDVGEIILARIIQIGKRTQFSTTAAFLPAAEITDIKEKVAAAKESYLAENPDADHTAFMRANNKMLIHHALVEAEKVGRPPVARLDPDRDDGAMQNAARLLARQLARRGRRR